MPTPDQIATVLQTAANYRFDVKKARIVVAGDDPNILLVDVQRHTKDTRVQREASVRNINLKLNCSGILNSWLGPEPEQNQARMRRAASLNRSRALYFDHTIEEVLQAKKRKQVTPPPTPPRSQFDWKQPREEGETPEGTMPQPIPETPRQASGDDTPDHRMKGLETTVREKDLDSYEFEGQTFKKMRRSEMVAAKMSREQRAEQYRRQRGKHPDDA